jgi:hypothetical protein
MWLYKKALVSIIHAYGSNSKWVEEVKILPLRAKAWMMLFEAEKLKTWMVVALSFVLLYFVEHQLQEYALKSVPRSEGDGLFAGTKWNAVHPRHYTDAHTITHAQRHKHPTNIHSNVHTHSLTHTHTVTHTHRERERERNRERKKCVFVLVFANVNV